MTDKELQDLIGLKKYEQPEEGYFNDFLVEFQQRQRAEMLRTSARGLLVERVKARFSEFGAMRWVIGAGAAYAAVALVFYMIPNQEMGDSPVASTSVENVNPNLSPEQEKLTSDSLGTELTDQLEALSMVFIEPVDFSAPAPAFSADERFF
jgi:hypothetical protein